MDVSYPNKMIRREGKGKSTLHCGGERRDPQAVEVKAVSAGAKPI